MLSNDEFILVKNRKWKKKSPKITLHNSNRITNIVEYTLPVENLISQTRDAVIEFKKSPYKTVLMNGLFESLQILGLHEFSQIICYGLGNFSNYRNAKYQLAALLTLKSFYKCDIYIYDPLFNASEIQALKLFGFNIIDKNEEGKRLIGDKVTLLFALHCSKQLINNFLYANWSQNLKNCIIYCNSWQEVIDSSINRDLERVASYIMKINSIVKEIKLNNNFTYFETFSSSSLHIFPTEKLSMISSDIWCTSEEPNYQDEDIEFVRNKMELSA